MNSPRDEKLNLDQNGTHREMRVTHENYCNNDPIPNTTKTERQWFVLEMANGTAFLSHANFLHRPARLQESSVHVT